MSLIYVGANNAKQNCTCPSTAGQAFKNVGGFLEKINHFFFTKNCEETFQKVSHFNLIISRYLVKPYNKHVTFTL